MKKAPFKAGQVVKYVGTRQVWDENMNLLIGPNMTVEIIEVRPPRKGYGHIATDADGEKIVDYDDDGYNIYERFGQRRIIWAKDKKLWEVIK